MTQTQIHRSKITAFLLVLFVFCCMLSACRAKRAKQSAVAVAEEKCAFFTIKMTKDTLLNKTSAEITGVNVVNTKVRYTLDEAKSKGPYFLKIEIMYSGNKTISAYTEHPLYKRLDLYSESGKIESKSISLSQGEVVLRVPYFEKHKKVTIIESVNFKESPPIILKNEK